MAKTCPPPLFVGVKLHMPPSGLLFWELEGLTGTPTLDASLALTAGLGFDISSIIISSIIFNIIHKIVSVKKLELSEPAYVCYLFHIYVISGFLISPVKI